MNLASIMNESGHSITKTTHRGPLVFYFVYLNIFKNE